MPCRRSKTLFRKLVFNLANQNDPLPEVGTFVKRSRQSMNSDPDAVHYICCSERIDYAAVIRSEPALFIVFQTIYNSESQLKQRLKFRKQSGSAMKLSQASTWA